MPANAIGPRKVAEAQKLMAARGKSRQGILKSTGHIRQMFAWGVAQELLKPDQLVSIRALQPVRYGAIEAPESKPLPPVPIPLVKATLPFLNEHTATMVKVQLLTGMRPGEVCALRLNDIDRSNPDCWVYRPLHKMRHLGRERTVPITRPVQKMLEPFLRADGKCLFSLQSVRCDANETYDNHSYRRAIKHACAAARSAQRKAGLAEDHENWSPNALRKAAAQHTANLASLDDARALLGHADKELTQRHYAKQDLVKATAAAKLMAVNLL